MSEGFPRNLMEFTSRFSTEEACAAYLLELRWPEGFVCPACQGGKGWSTARGTVYCAACKRQTSLTAGTILHGTRVSLRAWLLAMCLVCTQKTGLSAAGLQRELGLGSYRTAWLMLQKLRQAMVRLGRDSLHGSVEVDETYLGASESGVHGRQLVGKALVVIAVETAGKRIGRTRLRHVPDGSKASLVGFIRDCVEPGTLVRTDGWRGYAGLPVVGYTHRITVTRGDGELALSVFPHVHLVASLLKRWLGATHHGNVDPKHLQPYLDEFTFRFNRRHSKHVGLIFHRLAEQLFLRQGRTYRQITSS